MKPTPYPGYDILSKRQTPSWDDATRDVVAQRLNDVPVRRFFDEREWAVLVALCDAILPQPERENPVPIAPWIDAAMHEGRGTGTRYAALPEDRKAWRRGLSALDDEAHARHGCGFAALRPEKQEALLKAVDSGSVTAGAWDGIPPQVFLREIVLKHIVRVYYAHPAAMSEIGFGGPASPRGYVRMRPNRADPWEARFGLWDVS